MLSTYLIIAAIGVQQITAQIGCCSAWWFAPEGSVMTRLESTMVIPPLSSSAGKDGQVHFVWPGMEPRNGDFVFQNVIGDQQQHGKWSFATWYGPYDTHGDYHEYGQILVHEGDSLTTDFELDTDSGEWTDNWILVPGANGEAAGEESGSGGISISFPNQAPLTDTLFEIELQGGAKWDFGSVTWENIIMEANTTDTAWCTSPALGQYTFKYSMTPPRATVNGGSSSCYISQLVFVSP